MTKHTSTTGCNLSREDFSPGDPPCADGGEWWEHATASGPQEWVADLGGDE